MFQTPRIPVTVKHADKRKPEHRTVEQPRFYIQPAWQVARAMKQGARK